MIGPKDKLTPNVKRLLIEFMAKRHVDRVGRAAGDLMSNILHDLVTNSQALSGEARDALGDVNMAIKAVRSAAPPNQFAQSTDEEICEAILSRLEDRRANRTTTR